MADTYVINTVFKGQDQLSATISNATNKMNRFGRQSEKSFRKATKSATKFNTVLGGVLGANLISRGISGVTQSVGGLKDEFIGLDSAMTSAAAKFQIERGSEDFQEMEKAARDVAAAVPFTAAEAGKAFDFMAMAGFNLEQSIAALPGVTDLAIAGEMDLARASDIASDALGALGLESKDAKVQAANLQRIMDVMAKTSITSNTNIEMLWSSLQQTASVATGLGAEVEDLSAMFGTLAQSGVKQETAGTALRNMYLRLTGGTSEVTKVLKKYKVQIQDTNGKMRPMMDILDEVGKKTKKLDDKTRQAAFTHLFGARAVNSATLLMKAGKGRVDEYRDSLKKADGTAKKLAETIGKSVDNRLKAMKSRLIEVGLSVIDNFRDKIPAALDDTQKALDEIDPAEIVEDIVKVIETIGDFSEEIELAATAFIIYKGALMAATAWQWALNAAMVANPLGLLIAAFVAASTVLWIFYKDWDTISVVMKKDIVDLGRWIDEKITQPLERLMRKFPKISKFFGLKPRSEGEINRLYAMQAEAQQPGYILGQDTSGTAAGKALADQIRAEQGIDAYAAAPLQKVQVNGQFNFNNPPEGMSFEQETKGAPPISHNLGQN
jgi:TP901 family phage tail tape measure protein